MGSYTWHCTNTGDGYLSGVDADWATARADSWGDSDTTAAYEVGTYWGASLHYCSQGFLEFYTGDANRPPDGATITSVTLSLYMSSNQIPDANFILEAFKYDWGGGTLEQGDIRNATALQGLYDDGKLCATFSGYGKATSQYHDWSSDSDFTSLVDVTEGGYTRLVIAAKNHRDGAYGDPGTNTYWRASFSSANQTDQPHLTINWTTVATPTLTAQQHSGTTHIDVSWE